MSKSTKVEDERLPGCHDEDKEITELDNLLNNALNDFFLSEDRVKNMEGSRDAEHEATGNSNINPVIDSALLENLWNEPSMMEAMSFFENSLRSVLGETDGAKKSEDNLMNKTVELSADNVEKEVSSHDDIDLLLNDCRNMAKVTAETLKNGYDRKTITNSSDYEVILPEVSRSLMEVTKSISGCFTKYKLPTAVEGANTDQIQSMVSETMRNLSDNMAGLETDFSFSDCLAQLGSLLNDIESNIDVDNNFYKFIETCMKTIRSLIYPVLKDLCHKYPSYINDNKETLSESDILKCNKQFEVMKEICAILEFDETDNNCESGDAKNSFELQNDKTYIKFVKILKIMEEAQGCGEIPFELVSELGGVSADGQPTGGLNDMGQQCSIS